LAVIYGYTKIFDFMALLVPWKSWTLSTSKAKKLTEKFSAEIH
jgi:hypothetical protein